MLYHIVICVMRLEKDQACLSALFEDVLREIGLCLFALFFAVEGARQQPDPRSVTFEQRRQPRRQSRQVAFEQRQRASPAHPRRDYPLQPIHETSNPQFAIRNEPVAGCH